MRGKTVPIQDERVVIDTYAWIEYFRGSASGAKARRIIDGEYELLTPAVVIAELSDKYRKEGMIDWDARRRFVLLKSAIISLDETVADNAGELKQQLRKEHKDAGIVDAIILAHSISTNARILTGDSHLKSLKNSIDIICE